MRYTYDDTVILVFCKAPVAGYAKTRLMPELTAEQAVDVHQQLSERILTILHKAQLCPIQLWCSPDPYHPFFSHCEAEYSVTLHQQHGNDLGERMFQAIDLALKRYDNVLLVGCDCPSINTQDFEFAIKALHHNNDVVFAPAEDGGYVMVGMKKAYPELFLDMSWSHDQVLTTSLLTANKLGLSVVQTKTQWDVDTVEDLQRYQNLICETMS